MRILPNGFFPAIEIVVHHTRGSTPRETGTRMWVNATEIAGTIGGGNLEYTALKIARELLHARDGAAERRRTFALGAGLGQCCGGEVTLGFRRHARVPDSAILCEADEFEVSLFGAGHVGREVAHMLERLPCRLTWIDPRPEQFPAQVGENVRVVIEEEPRWMVDEAQPGSSYLVMTHSHALDFELVETILKRDDFAFLGLIGSHTKALKFRQQLAGRGIDEGRIARMVSPVGLVMDVKHPAAVAVSIVAQLVSQSSLRTGTSDRAGCALHP
jgi:xanthine dehydrogenase accessory factor